MAHDLELHHHSSVIEASNSEISHAVVVDLARNRQRLERTVEVLLVLLRRVLVDLIENLDGVPARVNQHACVECVNDACAL